MTVAPYGSWTSPITADLIAGATVSLGVLGVDGTDIYWTEGRPSEGGRSVIVRLARDGAQDVTPSGLNVRSRVHEYGGGAALVADGTVWFSSFADSRIHAQRIGKPPRPVTAESTDRFADFCLDRQRDRLYCVRERQREGGEPANEIVAVSLKDGRIQVIDAGHDFVANPRLDPSGTRLCWISWMHPDMPWDGTTLWVARIGPDGETDVPLRVAGGPGESVFQPEWGPDGTLVYVSDRSGWWNLYRHDGRRDEALCPMQAEFGLPQWTFGTRTYAITPSGDILATWRSEGMTHLGWVRDGTVSPIDLPYTEISGLVAGDGFAVFGWAAPDRMGEIVRLDLITGETAVLRRSADVEIDPGYLSAPESVSYPTSGGATAHALYYPPRNDGYTAPDGELPPLLVRGHGGPTGASSSSLSLAIQYWTSRGIAVLDVNYRGSTGFGRPYREALYGHWGVRDVDDMVAGADHLVERGLADPKRLIIRGGSAGGYTTLAALTFRDRFAAGASLYGIGDLMTLAGDTHKFESRYLDRLVGPLPEAEAVYRERSPVNHIDSLDCPVIFLQGMDDRIVPPNQAEAMVDALDAKGIPVAYVPFEGEGHGFRKAENVQRALEAELAFYGRVLGFAPADPVEPPEIRNLPPE